MRKNLCRAGTLFRAGTRAALAGVLGLAALAAPAHAVWWKMQVEPGLICPEDYSGPSYSGADFTVRILDMPNADYEVKARLRTNLEDIIVSPDVRTLSPQRPTAHFHFPNATFAPTGYSSKAGGITLMYKGPWGMEDIAVADILIGKPRTVRVKPYSMIPSSQGIATNQGEVSMQIEADGCLPEFVHLKVDFGHGWESMQPGRRVPHGKTPIYVWTAGEIMSVGRASSDAQKRPQEGLIPRRLKVVTSDPRSGHGHEAVFPIPGAPPTVMEMAGHKTKTVGQPPPKPVLPGMGSVEVMKSFPRMEAGNRMGGDYANRDLPAAQQCQAACAGEPQCRAWTWVKPGIQGPGGKCWLKNSVPPLSANDCCTSGVK